MDPKHPNIAFAANTGALVFFVALLFSFFLPIGTPKGWNLPETILVGLTPICFGISWWAKREHEIPVVHEHGSAEAQYEAMEDLPTMVSLDNEQDFVNPNTAAVIASIVGESSTQHEQAVSNAINTLSSGEIGKSSAAEVAHNDGASNPVNVGAKPQPIAEETSGVDNSVAKFDVRGFQTQGVASVPLPTTNPVSELPELPAIDLPEMLDLDDLFEDESTSITPPALDLPELPDFE